MTAGPRPQQIGKAPATIMHNGMEFVSTIEAARRLDVDIRTIAHYARQGRLKPYRIPGIGNIGVRQPYYFKADEIRKLMP